MQNWKTIEIYEANVSSQIWVIKHKTANMSPQATSSYKESVMKIKPEHFCQFCDVAKSGYFEPFLPWIILWMCQNHIFQVKIWLTWTHPLAICSRAIRIFRMKTFRSHSKVLNRPEDLNAQGQACLVSSPSTLPLSFTSTCHSCNGPQLITATSSGYYYPANGTRAARFLVDTSQS